VVAFNYLARTNVHWLWAVCGMIVGQYITDLLDGAIGRLRNTGLVKWGFYMDHFLDFMFLCAMLIGYALLIPQAYRTNVFFIMTIFAGFMVHSFLSFAATNRFQIAYMGIGPTELRIGFILASRRCPLARHPAQVWGVDYFGNTRTLDQHVALIRKKLGTSSEAIQTVHGVGYRLADGNI
jgi:phosphatidylglycerophosphate synthase